MANSSQGAPVAGASSGSRNTSQPLVVVFERDESLAGTLLGQLRAQGYECRSARTPVEVFDLIARYPVGLVLVNLGQAATSRREFWVALDAQRRGRGVQVVTYRYFVPGREHESTDGGSRADVEVRGAQGFAVLMEAVRAKLPLPSRPAPDSGFLLSSTPPPMSAVQSQPAAPGASAIPPLAQPPGHGAPQQIAGMLNFSDRPQGGQPREFMPMSASSGAPVSGPAPGLWVPQMSEMPPAGGQAMTGSAEQRVEQWLSGGAGAPGAANTPGPVMRQNVPGTPEMSHPAYTSGAHSAPPVSGQPGNVPGVSPYVPGVVNSPMPMGDLSGLTDAINALAAAGAPGYHRAAAAANAMNAANMSGIGDAARWRSEPVQPGQGDAMPGGRRDSTGPTGVPPEMNGGRPPAAQMPGREQTLNGDHAGGRYPAESPYAAQQVFEDLRQAQGMGQLPDTRSRTLSGGMHEPGQPPDMRSHVLTERMHERDQAQQMRSRSLSPGMDDYERTRRDSPSMTRSTGDEPFPGAGRRSSGGGGADAGDGLSSSRQQMVAPLPSSTQIERSLGNVLVEGQLVSPQRLEVALGIQRLLRGVDIDYRLGELLLLFKFLTPDQLLAALLVSRGLVTPAQVAAMGRIKQELHAIGIEYDLENLLVLFRLLSPDQLREIRSEVP